MATKKFKCKVCGYIHEGDAAPAKCPACQAPASEFEEITEGGQPKKKGINTSSNTYTYRVTGELPNAIHSREGRRLGMFTMIKEI